MNKNEFVQKVCSAAAYRLGERYQVAVSGAGESNGVRMHRLLVRHRYQEVTFAVYLNECWKYYESGMPFPQVMNRVMDICRCLEQIGDADIDYFKSFEKVKDRICYRLIGRKEDREWLESVPHIDFLDLKVFFYYVFQAGNQGEVEVQIKKTHMGMWETTSEELFELAKVNTPKLFPWKYCNILDMIYGDMELESDICDEGETDNLDDGIPRMWVLTNRSYQYGATCILYPEVLAKLAEKGQSYYILPSSVHECIFTKCEDEPERDSFKSMVEDVNRYQVPADEVLSYSVYFYDASERKIRLLT
ncbi:MAG TPA: hypothetical protein DCZ91_04795 [Lachnospiraceae bacterium]|nr:hypothetical protein [Lachnospiraceae bacterium]